MGGLWPGSKMKVSEDDLFYSGQYDLHTWIDNAIKAGADVNVCRFHTPLTWAIIHGSFNCVHTLIKSGADVNKRDDTGRTALMVAAADQSDNKYLELLLKAGADVNMYSPIMRSPGIS